MPSTNKLKFPILNNIEYIDLVKNKVTVLSIEGKEVEGMKWRAFQTLIGRKLPSQSYFYIIKKNDDASIFKGQVKAIGKIIKKPEDDKSSLESNGLQKTISDLNQRINDASSGSGVSVQMLMEVTKSSYVLQIDFLNNELTKKNTEIERLCVKVETLNDDLDNADGEIDDLKSKTGIVQYIQYAKEFLAMKTGSLKPITNLSDSDAADIPPEITTVLGVVDWTKVPEEVKTEIIHYLKMFIQKLPLKGK